MRHLFLFLSLILAVPIAAQIPLENHTRIREQIEYRDYEAAITELRSISASDPRYFSANNYDYLLARLCQKTGDRTCAVRTFAENAGQGSALKPYSLWHLAQLSRSSGNYGAERLQLLELLASSVNSLVADAARSRLAQSWFDSGNFELAAKQLLSLNSSSKGSLQRDNQLLLGRAFLYSGDPIKARQIFTDLISSGTNPAQPDDFSLEAVKGLDLLDVGSEKFGKAVAALSDYEHLRRAQIYQFNRDFADARLHFLSIVNNHPQSGIVPDAMYQIGRGYSQTAEYPEAAKWYERVGEEFPDHDVNKDALLQLASAYTRLSKHREAIARYERYIDRFPTDERVDRAYMNIIDVYRDLGEEGEAMKWAETTQNVFRGKTAEAQALFVQARMHMAREMWNEGLQDLDRLAKLSDLGETNLPGGTDRKEVSFLRGLVLEKLRRFPESIDAHLAIPDGRNEYYGGLATERLRSISADENASKAIAEKRASINGAGKTPDDRRKEIQTLVRLTNEKTERDKLLAELQKIYSTIPAYTAPTLGLAEVGRKIPRKASEKTPSPRHQTIADELIFLGLYDEAAPELEAARKETSASKETDYTLAYYYLKGDRADQALAFLELSSKIPADFQMELLPPAVAEILYPAPYTDELLKFAPQKNLDPRFLLSIMRQESRFRPNVKSVAAARGLMQFISTTSDRIASELGITNFRQDGLFYPPAAIRFGSHYVGNLFAMFPGEPAAVAASYNGGEDNMKRWMGRSKSHEPERYVPEISYSQSKDYVYRVMANFRMYKLLYDENLKRR